MTRSTVYRTAAVLLLLAATYVPSGAQNLTLQPESKLWVEGTSTRSDFTVQASELNAEFGIDGEAINLVRVTVPAAKMKGGKSTIMDRLMYDALKVTEHPLITYELSEAVNGAGSESFSVNAKGRLTLAGVTKDVDIAVEGERLAGGKLRLKGSTPLKMSDYGITPPTAMFGALRTGDDVTVHFDVVFAPPAG